MHFVTFVYNQVERIGVLSEDGKKIIAIDETCGLDGIGMVEFIKTFNTSYKERLLKAMIQEQGIPMEQVKMLAPIPRPERSVVCLGKNYMDHISEVAGAIDNNSGVPQYPIYFEKRVDKCPGNGENIPLHKNDTDSLDYEVELAVIIGKEGRDIQAEEVEDYIFGYAILNDISARDIQKQHTQWFRGKSLDGTCPMGPYIVHKDQITFPPMLKIKSYVNGELRQNGNTSDLIYDIPCIISDFSKGLTLKPGDIISTGTPAGVGMGFNPPKYLKAGDIVKCEIEKLGELINTVK